MLLFVLLAVVGLIGAYVGIADFYVSRIDVLSRRTMKTLFVSSFKVPGWLMPFIVMHKNASISVAGVTMNNVPVKQSKRDLFPVAYVMGISWCAVAMAHKLCDAEAKIAGAPLVSVRRIRVIVEEINKDITMRSLVHGKTMIRCFCSGIHKLHEIVDTDALCECEWCATLKRMVCFELE